MKKYTQKEFDEILRKHAALLSSSEGGEKANLCYADLSDANLRGANLCYANLCYANLSDANLRGANLCYADLRGADLRDANLRGANLCYADLRGADLRGANLCYANLCYANLSDANLRGADLSDADLSDADLRGANLSDADLRGANLCFPIACPEKGSFIAFKKVRNRYIVKLEVCADSLRSSATGRKCRCSKAKVISITNIDGTPASIDVAYSVYDGCFTYEVGKIVSVDDFDTNRWNECAPGIHFFITRQEAVNYVL